MPPRAPDRRACAPTRRGEGLHPAGRPPPSQSCKLARQPGEGEGGGRQLREAKEAVRNEVERNPMEPLLLKLARDFTDDQNLTDRLMKLYKVELPLP